MSSAMVFASITLPRMMMPGDPALRADPGDEPDEQCEYNRQRFLHHHPLAQRPVSTPTQTSSTARILTARSVVAWTRSSHGAWPFNADGNPAELAIPPRVA